MSVEAYLQHVPRIDPTAWVHPLAVVIGEVAIGAESSVWPAAVLRGDEGAIRIGSHTSIQDGSVVHATRGESVVTVGDRVTVGHKVILHGCAVEDDCLVGMGAILLDGATIGRGSLIGAGALVLGRVQIPPGSLVLGSPARVVRPVSDREQALIAEGWRTYIARVREYRAGSGSGGDPRHS